MIINIILMILACIALYLTVRFAGERKTFSLYAKSMLTMGISAFVICFAYSVMGISLQFNISRIARIAGIFMIDCFLIAEVLMFSSQLKINQTMLEVMDVLLIAVAVLDMLFFGNPSVARFVRVGERTCYYANKVWQRTFHSVFILVIAAGLIFVWYLCLKKAATKRERTTLRCIFWGNIALLISTLPDTFLPLMGYPSWPSSPIGVFVAYVVSVYTCEKYACFEITEQQMYQRLYQSAPIGCVTWNLDYTLAQSNDFAESLLGVGCVGSLFSELFELSEREERSLYKDVMTKGYLEEKLTTKLTQRPVRITLYVEYDKKQYPYCIVGTIVDLTDENRMLAELSQLDRSKTAFLMHMSHEIRTPVNTVLGMNEMILKKSEEHRIRGYAENIKNSCNLLISIINDILDFSKIESEELTLSEQEYSLSKLVNGLISMLEDRTNKKGLSMYIDIDKDLPDMLFGDEMRIRQIVTNLLTNAIKYSDYGTIKLLVKNDGRSKDTLQLRIHVVDTGKGIREEDKAKLFRAFQRVDESKNRHIEGTGLGLYITSHFVSMMGGTIGFESEYGKGSDFYVVIPQKVISEEKIGRIGEKETEIPCEPEKDRNISAPWASVLVVDDNEMNLMVARFLLEETGMVIDLATEGRQALSKMEEKTYHLIFLDHMMPEMDGIQVLHEMKEKGLQEGVPVIALTANAVSGAREMYMQEGFQDYLSKPIEKEKLQEILIKWLSMENGEQKAAEVTND